VFVCCAFVGLNNKLYKMQGKYITKIVGLLCDAWASVPWKAASSLFTVVTDNACYTTKQYGPILPWSLFLHKVVAISEHVTEFSITFYQPIRLQPRTFI